MTDPINEKPEQPGKRSAVFAAVWVVAFLAFFFLQDLPNNSTAEMPVTRVDIWRLIFSTGAPSYNPLDYSHDTVDAGWEFFPQRIPFMVVAAVLWLAAWIPGKVMVDQLLSNAGLLTSERLVIEFGGGISLLTVWILICGVLGWLSPSLLLAPSAAALVILLASRLLPILRFSSLHPASEVSCGDQEPVNRKIVFILLVPLIAFAWHIFLGGMTPPFDFDVREYHLQGPKEWWQAGQITTLKHNVYTSFPFLSEMVSLAAMVLHQDWWKGAISGKLALSGFQFLSALSVYAVCRRWAGCVPGLIAALALLSTPWTVRISIIAYAEGAITFFVIATVMAALITLKNSRSSDRRRLIGVTGLLAGSAMAAKYPGVLSAVIPAGGFLAFLSWQLREDNARGRNVPLVRDALAFVLGVMIAVGPWLVRNVVAEGNPVYPLAYSIFGAEDWSPEMDAKWKKAHSPPEHNVANIPQHLISVAARNDWQSGFLIAFAVPAVFLLRRQSWLRWISLHALLLLATWWAFTHRIDRFWIPLIPLLAVMAGSAWHVSRHAAWRGFMIVALAGCCVFNYAFCRLDVVGFHAGLMDMDAARKIPVRRDIALLNSSLPKNAKVLMVGEAEVFDAEFKLVYSTVFDENIFEEWTSRDEPNVPHAERTMKSADEIRSVLHENGITHVYVNWSEILRYRLTYGYTDYVFPERFARLQQMQVLQPPVTMSTGEWLSRSEQEQAEILSWPGGSSLRDGERFWNNIQLFRVVEPRALGVFGRNIF